MSVDHCEKGSQSKELSTSTSTLPALPPICFSSDENEDCIPRLFFQCRTLNDPSSSSQVVAVEPLKSYLYGVVTSNYFRKGRGRKTGIIQNRKSHFFQLPMVACTIEAAFAPHYFSGGFFPPLKFPRKYCAFI